MAKRRLGARRGGPFRATPAVLAALALLGAAVFLLARLANEAVPAQAVVDDALGAGAGVATAPVREIDGLFGFVDNAVRANARIEALQKENAELREWRALALALAERNERYEALLKMPPGSLAETLRPGAGVSARVVLDVGGPFRRTLLANAGADHGVAPGAVAVNENGLVGRVVVVGRRSSRLLLLDDYNSRVPVMGQTSRVRAVMVGSAGARASLEGAVVVAPPNLEFAVGDALRAGEPIVTSGDGGLFPAGIVVGRAAQDESGRWRVRLAASAAPIDFVRLLPFAPTVAPEVDDPRAGVPMPEITPRNLTTARQGVAAPQPPGSAPPRSAPAARAGAAPSRPGEAIPPEFVDLPVMPPTAPIEGEVDDTAPPPPEPVGVDG